MEKGSLHFNGFSVAVKKKRTQASRRPRPVEIYESYEPSPSSSVPSEDLSKVSSEENAAYDGNGKRKRKEFSLTQCMSRAASVSGIANGSPLKRSKKNGGNNNKDSSSNLINCNRSTEGLLAPTNWKSNSRVKEGFETEVRRSDAVDEGNGEKRSLFESETITDRLANEGKVNKVTLKLGKIGGNTRTTNSNSAANGVAGDGSSTKGSYYLDHSKLLPRQNLQENSGDSKSPLGKRTDLKGIPWKDFSRGGFSFAKGESEMGRKKGGDSNGPVRKSKRVPKRRKLDGDFDEDDSDGEIRFLDKLRLKTSATHKEGDVDRVRKETKPSRVSNGKKLKSDQASEDADYVEEDELASDNEAEGSKKKQQKEFVDSPVENRMTLTTRQRALQSSKDPNAPSGASQIEFPNGLPPAPSRKNKEKLTEVELQLKKTEAAQRRRLQVEKAARESEAEAIRKILGQDSSRKKREDKNKKRMEEIAQQKATSDQMLASNTIRTIMGPSGVTVTFPNQLGLPSIFDPRPVSYPPPREKCAGPLCSNPYKYRHSKTNVPLCSLKCYKAVEEEQKQQLL